MAITAPALLVSFSLATLAAAPSAVSNVSASSQARAQSRSAAPSTTPAPSVATPPALKPEERALELFEESAREYRDGHFGRAVELLLEARALAREPVLLYNLARAYEALGKLTEAIDAYARYLEEQPAALDRGAIEGRIATMRREIDERERLRRVRDAVPPVTAQSASMTTTLPNAASEQESSPAVPWALVAVGTAGVSAGLVLGAVSQGQADDARREPVQARALRDHEIASDYATAANVALGVGAALVVAGGIWLIARAVSHSPATARPRADGLVFGAVF